MTLKPALFVSAHPPSPTAAQAGHKTAFKYLRELAATHVVDLLLLCKASDLPLPAPDAEALRRVVRRLEIVPATTAGRIAGLVAGMAGGIAPRLATRFSTGGLQRFRRLLDETAYERVVLEFSQTFWLAPHAGPVPSMLSLHDVITQVVAGRGRVESLLSMGWTFRSEQRFLESARTIRLQSQKDAELVRSLFRVPADRILLAAPALSDFVARVRRSEATTEARSILFWGAMNRAENIEAALHLARHVLPEVQRTHPDTRLYIVGSRPPRSVEQLASATVVVTGFVEDAAPYFERCALGVAPMTSGAGIKVKVLEMLGVGMPVISTPVGAEGIASTPALDVVPIDAFACAIRRHWESMPPAAAATTGS